MTLKELTHEEQIALVAMMEMGMIRDGNMSDEEAAELDEIVHELGEEEFRALVDEAEGRFADREALKTYLRGITRQDARELIFGTALADSLIDTLVHDDAEFLAWLSKEWRINVAVEPEGG